MRFFCCIGRPKCGELAPELFVVLAGEEGATPVCLAHADEFKKAGFEIHRWRSERVEDDARDLADVVFG